MCMCVGGVGDKRGGETGCVCVCVREGGGGNSKADGKRVRKGEEKSKEGEEKKNESSAF